MCRFTNKLRYLSVRTPFRYQQIITKKRTLLLISGAWLCSIVLSSPKLFVWMLGHRVHPDTAKTVEIAHTFTVYTFVVVAGLMTAYFHHTIAGNSLSHAYFDPDTDHVCAASRHCTIMWPSVEVRIPWSNQFFLKRSYPNGAKADD